MNKGKFFCPNCGHHMEQIFCNCESLSDYKLYIQGEKMFHGDCGLQIRPELAEKIKKGEKK